MMSFITSELPAKIRLTQADVKSRHVCPTNCSYKKSELDNNYKGIKKSVAILHQMTGYLDSEVPAIYMQLR